MASGKCAVEAVAAFDSWVARHRPDSDEKGDMAAWLDECEQQGPPEAEDDGGGNLRAVGPHNTPVRFRRFDSPGRQQLMFVLKIG